MTKLKFTAIIIFLLCSRLSIGQDYYAYYEGIKKAKLALTADSLDKSVNHYVETFEKFDFVFARDCFNALEVASKIGDLNSTNYLFKRCLKQGVEFKLLQENPILTNFKESGFWSEILLVKDSLRDIYESKINWEVRNEVNLMFAEDQKIRDLADKNRFNIFKIRKLNRQFEEIDARLVLRLIEITKEYGFPGEKLIGLDTESMHPKIQSEILSAGMPILIFIHHFSQANESYNFLLINEIQTGSMYNEHYAVISDFQYEYGKGLFGNIPCYSQRFKPKESLGTINTKRAEIGLIDMANTYTLQRKKLITPFWMRLR